LPNFAKFRSIKKKPTRISINIKIKYEKIFFYF